MYPSRDASFQLSPPLAAIGSGMCICVVMLILCTPLRAHSQNTLPRLGADAEVEVHVEEIDTGGRVRAVLPGDYDGDGRTDLAVGYVEGVAPDEVRYLTLYWQDTEGAFATSKGATIALPDEAAILDVARLPGETADQLLSMTWSGIDSLDIEARAFGSTTRLSDIQTLVLHGERGDVTTMDFAGDHFGDGRTRLIVPQWARLAILEANPDDDSWTVVSRAAIPQEAWYRSGSRRHGFRQADQSLQVTIVTPAWKIVDVDGDGKRDLAVHRDENLFIYPASDHAVVSERPSSATHFPVRTDEEKTRGTARVTMRLGDVDGDGRIDAVVNKLHGGVRAMRSTTTVFPGRSDGTFSKKSSWSLDEAGYAASVNLVDIDDDGRHELVSPHAALGMLELSKVVLSGTIELDFRVFAAGPGEDTDPEQSFPFEVLLDYSAGARLKSPDPRFAGDFDGDGQPDLLLTSGADLFEFSPSRDGEFAVGSPTATARVPVSRNVQIFNAGSDPYDDVIVFDPNDEDTSHRVTVMLLRPKS